jgi:hypothetical protein
MAMDATNLVLNGLTRGGSILESTVHKLTGAAAARARRDRWNVVTVYRPAQEVMPDGRLPQPLAELEGEIEVQVRPAPADKGTELAARLAHAADGDGDADELRGRLRKALRHSKMLLETGEVLEPDKPGSAETTITNLPLELAIRRAQEAGRL